MPSLVAPDDGLCADLAAATSVRSAWAVFLPRDEKDPMAVAKAKEICFSCHRQLDCLRWSLTCNDGKPEEYGVLGGFTGPERKAFVKASKKWQREAA